MLSDLRLRALRLGNFVSYRHHDRLTSIGSVDSDWPLVYRHYLEHSSLDFLFDVRRKRKMMAREFGIVRRLPPFGIRRPSAPPICSSASRSPTARPPAVLPPVARPPASRPPAARTLTVYTLTAHLYWPLVISHDE